MINHRLEYCVPYYDYDLVDFSLALPLDLRWERKLQKLTLTRMSPKLAKLSTSGPLDVEYPLRIFWDRNIKRAKRVLNRIIHNQPKTPSSRRSSGSFTDLHSLLREPNRKWVELILLDERTLSRGYFQPHAIHRLVEEHMNGEHNIGRQLGILITFELWHRHFVD